MPPDFCKNTHEKVRRRALALISEWAGEFENNESLGLMEECYSNLKSKSWCIKFYTRRLH
jgi:signal transducing adaptor molecule